MHKQATILIVDDYKSNRALINGYLTGNGYDFLMAAGGREALAMLESETVDLILLDIMMPDINGIGVLKRLKANARLRDVPVIMVTAMEEEKSLPACLELGANDYVTKPVKASVLKARVASQLTRQRAMDERHRDLTLRVDEKSCALQQARKMEAIGTLTGGIAHQFNNMLAGMAGNLYLARLHSRNLPAVVHNLDNMETISIRAADMIQQLLIFASKDMVSMKYLPLNASIGTILDALSVPMHIPIYADICDHPMQVLADEARLRQILLQLLNNARDALAGVDEPVITVQLDAWCADELFVEQHPYVEVGTYARLSVTDNGCGIPEKMKAHLFEPFFSTKEVGQGDGLGLSLVFGAVKTHQGFVEVDSIEGEGSTFHVYLPLREGKQDA